MPVIEAAALGVVASAGNAFITLWKHGSHFVDIPAEVEQFKVAIDNLETAMTTTRRLRRVNSSYLDQATKTEVDGSLTRSQSVLESICRTIEKCRADLQVKGTVSSKNRIDWIFSGHDQFMARLMTLNSCLTILSMQIHRMDGMKPAVKISIASIEEPSTYDPPMLENKLRPPSLRRKELRRKSFSNMSVLSQETLVEGDGRDDASMYAPEEFHTAPNTYTPCASCGGNYCPATMCNNYAGVRRRPIAIQVEQTMIVNDWENDRPDPVPFEGGTKMKFTTMTTTTSLRRNRSGLV